MDQIWNTNRTGMAATLVLTLILLLSPPGGAQAPFHAPPPDYPIVSAHRGGWGPGVVENSLAAFEHTWERIPGCWMEIDVAMSADSVLFLHHDWTLDRTTTGSGPPDSLTWTELQPLRLIDERGDTLSHGLTRFDQALAWGRGRTVFAIDVKPSADLVRIARTINTAGMNDDVLIITRDLDDALAWHAANPNLLLQVFLNHAREDTVLAHYEAAGIPRERLTACVRGYERDEAGEYSRLFARLRKRAVYPTVLVFELDDRADREGYSVYLPLMRDGAAVFATDRPALVRMAERVFKASR